MTINFQFDSIHDRFHIDVVTDDPIYLRPNNYGYKALIEERTYNIWSYSIIETILNMLETNGRMKDYYDIYLIYTYGLQYLNKSDIRKAVDILKNSKILQNK